jgi:hypothetical protein
MSEGKEPSGIALRLRVYDGVKDEEYVADFSLTGNDPRLWQMVNDFKRHVNGIIEAFKKSDAARSASK